MSPPSVLTSPRVVHRLHRKLMDVGKSLFWCLSPPYLCLLFLSSLDYWFWSTLQLFCSRIIGRGEQKFLVRTNLVAEKLQHLPSPHPFQQQLHVCFAVQSTHARFLIWKAVLDRRAIKFNSIHCFSRGLMNGAQFLYVINIPTAFPCHRHDGLSHHWLL